MNRKTPIIGENCNSQKFLAFILYKNLCRKIAISYHPVDINEISYNETGLDLKKAPFVPHASPMYYYNRLTINSHYDYSRQVKAHLIPHL